MKTCKTKAKKRKAKTQFLDSTNIVDCPGHIRRRMWRNLRKAAACKVNPLGKARAEELLATLEVQSDTKASKSPDKPAALKNQTNAASPPEHTGRHDARHVLRSARSVFKKGVTAVRRFAGQTFAFRVAHSR